MCGASEHRRKGVDLLCQLWACPCQEPSCSSFPTLPMCTECRALLEQQQQKKKNTQVGLIVTSLSHADAKAFSFNFSAFPDQGRV